MSGKKKRKIRGDCQDFFENKFLLRIERRRNFSLIDVQNIFSFRRITRARRMLYFIRDKERRHPPSLERINSWKTPVRVLRSSIITQRYSHFSIKRSAVIRHHMFITSTPFPENSQKLNNEVAQLSNVLRTFKNEYFLILMHP